MREESWTQSIGPTPLSNALNNKLEIAGGNVNNEMLSGRNVYFMKTMSLFAISMCRVEYIVHGNQQRSGVPCVGDLWLQKFALVNTRCNSLKWGKLGLMYIHLQPIQFHCVKKSVKWHQ